MFQIKPIERIHLMRFRINKCDLKNGIGVNSTKKASKGYFANKKNTFHVNY